MAWGATISQPYAVAVFSVTASAAFRITSSTKSGWDSIGTWLLLVSKVFAPIRFATKRSKAGWIVRSLLATMYQLGFDLQGWELFLKALCRFSRVGCKCSYIDECSHPRVRARRSDDRAAVRVLNQDYGTADPLQSPSH